jgi:hypothetical protein
VEFDRFTKKLARWLLFFMYYDFDVKHWDEEINILVDALNRNPCVGW